MKSLIGLVLATCFVVSCTGAPSQARTINPYAHVTSDSVKQHCQAIESWRIGVLGLPGHVFKFEKCLQVNVLLVVTVDDESYTEEIRENSVKLLVAHYIEFLKRTDEQEGRLKRAYSVEKLNSERSEGWQTNYFSLTYKNLTCTEEACKNK
tara:strand:- start:82413 stop:82865 length:453 start_codon:yes stop_codon:yes gene_type:complete